MVGRNNKILTIALVLVIIITFVINVKIFHELRKRQKYMAEQLKHQEQAEEEEKEYYSSVEWQKLENTSTFYNVKFCIEKYYSTWNYIWIDNSKELIFGDEELPETLSGYTINDDYVERLLNLLSQEYKAENNIDEHLISEKYSFLPDGKPVIYDIYEYNMETGLSAYIVYGNYITKNKDIEKENFKIMVLIDKNLRTFEIYPDEYVNEIQLDEFTEVEKLDFLNNKKSIQANNFNTITTQIITDEKITEDYFYLFKFVLRYSPETAYEMLNKEYRIKKFGNFGTFKQYIEEHKQYLTSSLKEYAVTRSNEYKQYVGVDKNNYYYIFREKNCLDYDLLLDTYTIDIPEFIEKYDNANDKEKAALNTKKFIDAVNEYDYKYAYNCLADQFKENKFSTLESFEIYIKENFFDKNDFEFLEFNNEGETYIFSIKITDSKGEDTREAILQVIMELKENRNFIMSFNIQSSEN